jgi:hypothetical protein
VDKFSRGTMNNDSMNIENKGSEWITHVEVPDQNPY